MLGAPSRLETSPANASDLGLTPRQTRAVIGLKVLEYVGLVGFTVAVPRLMGPELYGRFASMLATVTLLIMASGLGAQAAFGRFIPEFQLRGEAAKAKAFFSQLLLFRLGLAAAFGPILLLLFYRLPSGIPLGAAACATAALLVGSLSSTCYQFCYGLNELGRSLARDSLQRIVLLAAILALGGTASLVRASAALLVTEAALLFLALSWVGRYFTMDRSGLELPLVLAHLRFGSTLFAANLLLLVPWRAGELVLLSFAGSAEQVAYFSVANAIVLAMAALIGHSAQMVIPSVTALHLSGDPERANDWLGHLLRYLTVAGIFGMLALHAAAPDVIPRLVGADYRPSVANLRVGSLALIPVALLRTCFSLAVARTEAGRYLRVTGVGFVVWLAAAAILGPYLGALGATAALVLGLGTAAAAALVAFPLGPILAVARYGRVVGLGALALGVALIPGVPTRVTGALALFGYAGLLLVTRAVTLAELGRAVRYLGGVRSPPTPGANG